MLPQDPDEHRILDARRAGVLLHPTSLPGPLEYGDLGQGAYRFIDFLARTGVSLWQTLPLGPTSNELSPYQSLSAHAGNPLLIDWEWLRSRGLLTAQELETNPATSASRRFEVLEMAGRRFRRDANAGFREAYRVWAEDHTWWLSDYALYIAIRRLRGRRPWWEWPPPLRDRDPVALAEIVDSAQELLEQVRFEQYVFFRQWEDLRGYAKAKGILMFGDMPIFVSQDSAEVWASRDLFRIDADGRPEVVAGVPPDYFSQTGQRWGNPLYRWDRMSADGFAWWVGRMRTQIELFDLVRVDHFRGFQAYWEIPAKEETAIHGQWVEAPGRELLTALYRHFGKLPVVAEDLGIITEAVDRLRSAFHIPGMKVLQFAFDGSPDNPYLPHNFEPCSLVYTGTHDNDTTLSWYAGLGEADRRYINDYLGDPREPMPWPMIRLALASTARYAVIPMQDVLGLGAGNRMNLPGSPSGNWRWRYREEQLTESIEARLGHLVRLYGR